MRLLAAILALLSVSARAALTIALAPGVQNAGHGTERVFSGILTNTSTTQNVFLNGLHVTLSGNAAAHVALQPNVFFANVPGILSPGEVYIGPIFRVALGAAAPSADYTGSITLDGGSDIFATGNLASANFGILSPDVIIIASDPSASEVGPDSGLFTVSRTGRTDIALAVPCATTGSAGNGTSYQAISPALTIPANAASTVVTITPIPDNLAQGDRVATLSLIAQPDADYNPGISAAASVTIHDKPADAWRFANFGANANTPAAADGADWDSDGVKNVVEFALNLDPRTPDSAALPVPFLSGGYLTLSYVPNSAAADVNYAVEASTDFSDWNTTDVVAVSIANPVPPNRVTVRYRFPVSLSSRVFLRLSIVRP